MNLDDYINIIIESILLLNLNITNNIIDKFKLNDEIKETELFSKKIFKKSKGKLKLLNKGKISKPIKLEISYASKSAIETLEKIGGKINIINN